MGKVVDLRDDFVEAVDLLDHDFVEVASKIGVVEALGQELGEGLDRNERISNFVRHARGQVGPESRAIEQILFLTKDSSGVISWMTATAPSGSCW